MKEATPRINREAWLTAWVHVFCAMFAAAGAPLPTELRICCGGPVRRRPGAKHWKLYCCWVSRSSVDQSWEILVSPSLDDSVLVYAVVAAALVRIATWPDSNGHYASVARAVGLAGGASAPRARESLLIRVHDFLRAYGPYPHRAIAGPPEGYRPQTSRRFRMVCSGCGCWASMTALWIRCAALRCEKCDRRLTVDPRDAQRLAQPPRRRGRPRKRGSLSLAGRGSG